MSPAGASDDKVQLGLSADASADLDRIEEDLKLPDRVDGYRFAVAVALAKGLVPTPEKVSRGTSYSAMGTLDTDGSLRAAVLALRNDHDGRPYALIERLAEAGLRDLVTHLDSGLPLRDYLAPLVPTMPGGEPVSS